jgi:hypothetical protein
MKKICIICRKEMTEKGSYHSACYPRSKPAPVRALIDARVVCEPNSYVGRWARTEEERAQELERWCDEFNDFIRDHRSRDDAYLSVEKTYEEQCIYCKRPWEIDEDGPNCCSLAQEEWNARNMLGVQ